MPFYDDRRKCCYTPVSATTLYVYPGGVGTAGATTTTTARAGGANGSRSATSTNTSNGDGAVGGASHVALMTGTLASIGAANLSQILIVAGGGGGASYGNNGNGTGGGTSGAGTGPGTQTSGNAFGQGGSASSAYAAGGRGGLYGGNSSTNATPGGGGSGYIGGVVNGYTQTGQSSGSVLFANGLIGNCFGQFGRHTFSEKGIIPTMEFGTRGSATQMNLLTTFSVANTFARINSSVAIGINGTAANSWRITMVFNQPTTADNWGTNAFQNSYLPYITVFVNHTDASAVGVNNSWRGLIFRTVTIMPPM